MQLIFNFVLFCYPHTSSISFAVLGFHWSKVTNSRYVIISTFQPCILVCVSLFLKYVCMSVSPSPLSLSYKCVCVCVCMSVPPTLSPKYMCMSAPLSPHTQTHTHTHRGWLKSSQADQNTLMGCDQMRLIFQHNPPCRLHSSSIGVVVLGFHWRKVTNARYVII